MIFLEDYETTSEIGICQLAHPCTVMPGTILTLSVAQGNTTVRRNFTVKKAGKVNSVKIFRGITRFDKPFTIKPVWPK